MSFRPSAYRTHSCADLRASHVGETVRISGWVHRVRDHGGVLFIDLRDHFGMTQVVIDPDSDAFATAETVRGEWCLSIQGDVKARAEETVNKDLSTGEIEIYARVIDVLGAADELPLPVFGEPEYPEDVRLKYRFLDLRRETMHANMVARSNIVRAMREHMNDAGFTEFQTPILTASSPEGARDFLVPSRIHAGKFYALPQAPQQFKQLIMMSGFDRYFQIAPCFRDEDPRADRLPGEFYQLDLEMAFVEQDDVLSTMEPVLRGLFEQFSEGKPVTQDFLRIPHHEAIAKYGSDKPDLRNPIEMADVSDHFRDSGFKIFARMLEEDERVQVWAIPAKTGGSRAFCDRMNSWAQGEGQPGLGYIFWRDEDGATTGAGPLAKNIGADRTDAVRQQLGLEAGDACFFVAGIPSRFVDFAGAARTRVGEELNLIDTERFELCWIVDFPMYERDETTKKIDFAHNPFSMPEGGLEGLETRDPLELSAAQYDLVCNGFEIASGAIRNHKPEIMKKAFEIAGYSEEVLIERFGGMYRAFHYGAPPHGGMAAGVDRIVMLLIGTKNVRETTMFPMNQQAMDLLMGAPSEVSSAQLQDLNIRVIPPAPKG
ncbi:MAG: aspartate--tRNA ligase [Pseudomonadota bacterium]